MKKTEKTFTIKKSDSCSFLTMHADIIRPVQDFIKSNVGIDFIETGSKVAGFDVQKEIADDDYQITIIVQKNYNKREKDQIILNSVTKTLRKKVYDMLIDDYPNIKMDDIGHPYTEEDGWECESNENPLDTCVYIYDSIYDDETCSYCGEPEERK